MAILVDETTRVVVQGITGHEGTFHSLRNRAYGTQVVAVQIEKVEDEVDDRQLRAELSPEATAAGQVDARL